MISRKQFFNRIYREYDIHIMEIKLDIDLSDYSLIVNLVDTTSLSWRVHKEYKEVDYKLLIDDMNFLKKLFEIDFI